jgi:S-adenosylmethionine synthetase
MFEKVNPGHPDKMADQVDFFCEKVTLLADACGVTKHKED